MDSSSSSSAPCAACRLLRRKCTTNCIFAPHFPGDQPHRFAAVHKMFGASNIAKILNELNPSIRNEAMATLVAQAEARIQDPKQGCVGLVSILQHRLRHMHQDLGNKKKEISTQKSRSAMLHGHPQYPTPFYDQPAVPYGVQPVVPWAGAATSADQQLQQQFVFQSAEQFAMDGAAREMQEMAARHRHQ